mmetsp:Transcript_14002/g.29278  ORF Transcript_14002/g.29278 Transcript_14002/m.29278 type:complete len:239 (-) Transcript_14002:302-1018(-)
MAMNEHRHQYGVGISWEEFRRIFLGLVRSTLELQSACHGLVHGDINEGNVLYNNNNDGDDDDDKDYNNNYNDKKTTTSRTRPISSVSTSITTSSRLVLIDWDEAMRPKPCHRATHTDEERLRYPECLINFPEQYTKQQLMHLFGTLVCKYYPSQAERAKAETTTTTTSTTTKNEPPCFGTVDVNVPSSSSWMVPILWDPTNTNATVAVMRKDAKFLGRLAVEDRFRAMVRGLERRHCD